MRPGAEAHTDSGTMTGKLTAQDPTHLLRTYPHRASGKRACGVAGAQRQPAWSVGCRSGAEGGEARQWGWW